MTSMIYSKRPYSPIPAILQKSQQVFAAKPICRVVDTLLLWPLLFLNSISRGAFSGPLPAFPFSPYPNYYPPEFLKINDLVEHSAEHRNDVERPCLLELVQNEFPMKLCEQKHLQLQFAQESYSWKSPPFQNKLIASRSKASIQSLTWLLFSKTVLQSVQSFYSLASFPFSRLATRTFLRVFFDTRNPIVTAFLALKFQHVRIMTMINRLSIQKTA